MSTILSGIPRSEIRDGMLADGRIFCCGGPNESDYSIWFLVANGSEASVGDIVSVRMGSRVVRGDTMQANPNRLTGVVTQRDQLGEHCRWVPENPELWARVLYCDWMHKQGWTQQGGLFNVWVKPAGKE